MKILITTMILGGFVGDSGQMWHIANGLIKKGHQVDVLTSDGNAWFYDKEKAKKYDETVRKKILNTDGKKVIINGVNTFAVHCISESCGMYSPNLKKIANKIIKNYDLVYAIHWYDYITMEMSKIAINNNIPFVVAAYGSLQESARNINKKWLKKICDVVYTKNIIKNASAFHSVGDLETEEYVKIGVKSEKIFRIDHGVILSDYKIEKRSNIIEKLGIKLEKDKYIIFVGKLNEKKGIDYLLKAFSQLKEIQNLFLIIVGNGEEKYVKKLIKLQGILNLKEKVKFTGLVSHNEKLELLESAAIFVTTSHSDVHSIAAQEALLMGVPVIISKDSDWPEIQEYNAGILIDINLDSITNAIMQLITNNEELKKCSQNAKRLVNEKFLMKHIIDQYETEFLKVIKE